ncbi:MAG: hypothetical protein KDD37_03395, partial [Bdellovibrionales bacterium]|nr:hypothetical protein [Bdellovibrionales bacterium]
VIILFSMPLQAADRFQELFLWKMSEALKLSAEKEEAFATAVRTLNEKKAKALQDIDTSLAKMKGASTENNAKVQVTKYKEALDAYHNVAQEELTEMSKIFNYSELSKYLTIKMEIIKRLQEKMLDSQKESKTEVGPRKPKIILDE